MGLSIAQVIKRARTELRELTGLEISSTLQATRGDDGWRVVIEAVEKHSIPDGMDIMAIYETIIDQDGNLVEFNRTNMRRRMDIEVGEE